MDRMAARERRLVKNKLRAYVLSRVSGSFAFSLFNEIAILRFSLRQ
jgi:hypothetical protein